MARYIVGSSSVLRALPGVGSLNAKASLAASTIMNATGGTISYSGNYKIHTFTTSDTFTVTSGTAYEIEYLLVGGGGQGGGGASTAGFNGGGAGGGGFLEYIIGNQQGADFVGVKILVSAGDSLTVTVGGAGGSSIITNSTYYVEAVYGGWGCSGGSNSQGVASGGGGSAGGNYQYGTNNSLYSEGPIVYRPRQGYAAHDKRGGSGAGGPCPSGNNSGPGRTSVITGVTYSTGGIAAWTGTGSTAPARSANTGDGGYGGAGGSGYKGGGAGGSGIVVIRYKYQ